MFLSNVADTSVLGSEKLGVGRLLLLVESDEGWYPKTTFLHREEEDGSVG